MNNFINCGENKILIENNRLITGNSILLINYEFHDLNIYPFENELLVSFKISNYKCYVIWNYINSYSYHILVEKNLIIDHYGYLYNNLMNVKSIKYFNFNGGSITIYLENSNFSLKKFKKINLTKVVSCISDKYTLDNLPRELLLNIFKKNNFPNRLISNLLQKSSSKIINTEKYRNLCQQTLDVTCLDPLSNIDMENCSISQTFYVSQNIENLVIKNSVVNEINLYDSKVRKLILKSVYFETMLLNSHLSYLEISIKKGCYMKTHIIELPNLKTLITTSSIKNYCCSEIIFENLILKNLTSLKKISCYNLSKLDKSDLVLDELNLNTCSSSYQNNYNKLLKIIKDYHNNIYSKTISTPNFITDNYGEKLIYLNISNINTNSLIDIYLTNIDKLCINYLHLKLCKLPINLKILVIKNDTSELFCNIKIELPYTLRIIYYDNFTNVITTRKDIVIKFNTFVN